MLGLPRAVATVARSRPCCVMVRTFPRSTTSRNRAPSDRKFKKYYSSNSSDGPQPVPKRPSRKRKFALVGLGLFAGWLLAVLSDFFSDESEPDDEENIKKLDSWMIDITRTRDSAFADFAVEHLPVSVRGSQGAWRFLSLDGHDISTNEMIQLMKTIEAKSGKPIFESFDYIIGTAGNDGAFLASLAGYLRMSATEIEKCLSLFQEFTTEPEAYYQSPEEKAASSVSSSFSELAQSYPKDFVACLETLLKQRLGADYVHIRTNHPKFALGPKVAVVLPKSDDHDGATVIRSYDVLGPPGDISKQVREDQKSTSPKTALLDVLLASCFPLSGPRVVLSEVASVEIRRFFPETSSQLGDFISISKSKALDLDLLAKISQTPPRAEDWLARFEHAARALDYGPARTCMENALKIYRQDPTPEFRDRLIATLFAHISSDELDDTKTRLAQFFPTVEISNILGTHLPSLLVESSRDPARKAQLLALDAIRSLQLDSNPRRAAMLMDEAIDLAGKAGDVTLQGSLLLRRATMSHLLQTSDKMHPKHVSETLTYCDKAIQLLRKSSVESKPDLEMLYRALTFKALTIGAKFDDSKLRKDAESMGIELLNAARRLDDPIRICQALRHAAFLSADINTKINYLNQILDYEAPRISDPYEMKAIRGLTLHHLAQVVCEQDPERAFEYSKQACDIYLERTADPHWNRSFALSQCAEMAISLKREEATIIEYLKKAILFAKRDSNMDVHYKGLKLLVPLIADKTHGRYSAMKFAGDLFKFATVYGDPELALEASVTAAQIGQKLNSQMANMYWLFALSLMTTQRHQDQRLMAFVNLAEYFTNVALELKAVEYAKEAIPLAEAAKDLEALSRLYGILVQNNVRMGNYLDALRYSSLQFDNLSKLSRDDAQAHLWLGLALAAADANGSRIGDAIHHIQRSQALVREHPDLKEEAEITLIAIEAQETILKERHQHLSFIESLRTEKMLEGLKKQAEAQGDLTLIARLATKLGDINMQQGMTSDASKYYIEALEACEEIEDPLSESKLLTKLAACQTQDGHFSNAIFAWCAAYEALGESDFDSDRRELCSSFAQFAAQHGLPRTATQTLRQLKASLPKLTDPIDDLPELWKRPYLQACKVELELQQYDLAVEDGETAIQFSKRAGNDHLGLYDAYITTASAYRMLGNHEKSAEYSRIAAEIQEQYANSVFDEHMGALSRDAELTTDVSVDPLLATTNPPSQQ